MSNKIDFVIIWVDGNDVEWQEEKKKYVEKNTDNRNIRYRDWENLKYWFRGVEEYAPWVNKIYFVTWGHIPKWLNTENEKIVVVNHKEFIPNEYLPTFSSHVIELNLHRIQGLSEQFVYFNDDMFIINKVKPEDFFKDGKPCDSAILSPAIKENKYGIGNIELNNMAIINTYFNKNNQIKNKPLNWFNIKYGFEHGLKNILLFPWNSFTSFYEFHIASNFLKSTFEEVWKKEYEELNETCLHKFRNLKSDVNQWLIRDWQLASNNFTIRKADFGKLYTLDSNTDVNQIFKNNRHKMICINDSNEIDEKQFEYLKKTVINNFESKLPLKSSFEK